MERLDVSGIRHTFGLLEVFVFLFVWLDTGTFLARMKREIEKGERSKTSTLHLGSGVPYFLVRKQEGLRILVVHLHIVLWQQQEFGK